MSGLASHQYYPGSILNGVIVSGFSQSYHASSLFIRILALRNIHLISLLAALKVFRAVQMSQLCVYRAGCRNVNTYSYLEGTGLIPGSGYHDFWITCIAKQKCVILRTMYVTAVFPPTSVNFCICNCSVKFHPWSSKTTSHVNEPVLWDIIYIGRYVNYHILFRYKHSCFLCIFTPNFIVIYIAIQGISHIDDLGLFAKHFRDTFVHLNISMFSVEFEPMPLDLPARHFPEDH